MADEARGLEHVRVQMAKQMSKEQESAFKEKLETLLNRNVDMSVEVDPSLIGGMIVYAGSRVYDGSLKGQLRELGRELSE